MSRDLRTQCVTAAGAGESARVRGCRARVAGGRELPKDAKAHDARRTPICACENVEFSDESSTWRRRHGSVAASTLGACPDSLVVGADAASRARAGL
jgi:hypothetical protein